MEPVEKLNIEHILRVIQQEAKKQKALDPRPNRNVLNYKPITIKTYVTKKALIKNKIKKIVLGRAYVKLILRDLPFLGYVLRWGFSLLRLPLKLQKLSGDVAHLHNLIQQEYRSLNAISQKQDEHERTIYQFHDNNRNFNALHQKFSGQISALFEEILSVRNTMHASIFKVNELHGYVTQVTDALKNTVSGDKKQVLEAEEGHYLDPFYVAFEDKFRGSCQDVAQRLEVYLPYFKECSVDFTKAPILDVGCGRGEWLKLLKLNGYDGWGVDLNRIMVATCQSQHLNVIEQDAISYLAQKESASLGAITGFQIVEHFPFKSLIRLLDEAFRVLVTGGMVLFETPNPENLIVGSCNFYTDPTHRNPIPPHALRFVVEQRGFQQSRFIHSSPMRDEASFPQDPHLREIYEKMYGPQDYAVVAYKLS